MINVQTHSKVLGTLLLISASTTQAALIDRGNGMIYDDDLDITWLADANYAMTSGYDADGLMNWNDAMTWADGLNYGGYSDWRLATGDTVCTPGLFNTCTGGELGHLFYDELGGVYNSHIFNSSDPDLALFDNLQASIDPFISFYWTSTQSVEFSLNGPVYRPQAFSFDQGSIQLFDASFENFAWAVRDGDVSAVPVPASVWLLGSGLLALLGMARRQA